MTDEQNVEEIELPTEPDSTPDPVEDVIGSGGMPEATPDPAADEDLTDEDMEVATEAAPTVAEEAGQRKADAQRNSNINTSAKNKRKYG